MGYPVKITITAIAELDPEWYDEEEQDVASMIRVEKDNAIRDPEGMLDFMIARGDNYSIEIHPYDPDEETPSV